MFDYKQRPWSRPLTDEEYDRAVGRLADSPSDEPKPIFVGLDLSSKSESDKPVIVPRPQEAS